MYTPPVPHHPYLDKNGFIGTKLKDFGDAAQRHGMYCLGLEWLGVTYKANAWWLISSTYLYHPRKPHLWRRHPDPDKWYSDWDRFSRDQATPVVIALGEFEDKELLRTWTWAHIKRVGFFTNTRHNWVYKDEEEHIRKSPTHRSWNYKWKLPDFSGPEFWGVIIRSNNWWLLWPLLCLCDLETFIGSIFRRFSNDKDVLNHCIVSLYINRKYPTWIGRLVRWVNNPKDLTEKLHRYFNGHQWPGMAQIYEELLAREYKLRL